MRIGGLAMLVERAADRVTSPVLQRYRRAITLGALREDVAYLPGLPKPVEHLSFSHTWKGYLPGWTTAPEAADRWFSRAVRTHREGEQARGFVELGRAAHLLADMACPVHVHGFAHHPGDGYEWFVETHGEELAALPIPATPSAERASDLVDGLAWFTSRFPGDRTQHPVGRWLVRRGLARGVRQHELRDAAAQIIPVAIAHMTGLLELYVRRIDA
jgi:hypothetical protein